MEELLEIYDMQGDLIMTHSNNEKHEIKGKLIKILQI